MDLSQDDQPSSKMSLHWLAVGTGVLCLMLAAVFLFMAFVSNKATTIYLNLAASFFATSVLCFATLAYLKQLTSGQFAFGLLIWLLLLIGLLQKWLLQDTSPRGFLMNAALYLAVVLLNVFVRRKQVADELRLLAKETLFFTSLILALTTFAPPSQGDILSSTILSILSAFDIPTSVMANVQTYVALQYLLVALVSLLALSTVQYTALDRFLTTPVAAKCTIMVALLAVLTSLGTMAWRGIGENYLDLMPVGIIFVCFVFIFAGYKQLSLGSLTRAEKRGAYPRTGGQARPGRP